MLPYCDVNQRFTHTSMECGEMVNNDDGECVKAKEMDCRVDGHCNEENGVLRLDLCKVMCGEALEQQ